MSWRDLFSGRSDGPDPIEQHVLDMLDADRETLELASSGLLGSDDPQSLRQAVSDSDHRVNLLVQQVRRELVVRATVRARIDIGFVLATMSIVKDVERAGDYAKQLLRIARFHGPFPPGTAEHARLATYIDRVAGHITEVREALCEHDPEVASELLTAVHALTEELGDEINALLAADPAAADGAARALAYQSLARTSAHLGNVLTSLVMPLDKLDFYDES
jgi:phosphate uptake regulator